MCHKYSFLLDRAGHIYDGGGLTESHSEIARLHRVDEDKCNKYEWKPPKDWPDAEVLDGLVKDAEVFTPGASALKRISAHVTAKFPDRAAFEAATPIDERWHEQKVTLGGREITIICRPTGLILRDGTFWVIGQTVEAGGNATVVVWDNATVVAWDNATVKAWDNATVKAWDNATVKAWDNATVVYPANGWYDKVSTALKNQAVLIDRRQGGLVITRGDGK